MSAAAVVLDESVLAFEAMARGLRPDPPLRVSEWADKYRTLTSRSSPEPGQWSTARTPYLEAVMDALSPSSRVEIVVFMKGAQIGAALALDTPIATVTGWTTMGAIRAGDWVFDENGQPCEVLLASEIHEQRLCYRVLFSDAAEIVADADHRWRVWDDLGPGKRHLRILTTAEMLPRHRVRGLRNRYAIEVTGPLVTPRADLPIDPYLLGVWLGNGSNSMNQITVHEQDTEFIELLAGCGFAAEFRLPEWRKGRAANILIDGGREAQRSTEGRFLPATATMEADSFMDRLRALGLVRNKHIPAIYLRASMSQRQALLQGLMDTDGSCEANGRSEFSTSTDALREGVVELLTSLGLKPTVYTQTGPTGFRDYDKPSYRVSFLAYADFPVFRLRRKLARQKPRDRNTRETETFRRRIVAIEPVESVPVRCIAVNSESHLYLAGRAMIPTHNTEAGNNWIGYNIHQAPGPMMAVQPTVDMAKRNSKQRIAPLIEECAPLKALVKDSRSRDAGNTVLAKEFPGGILVMTGANSGKGLRSMSARYLFLDEVDGYPGEVDGEGDPCDLAITRTNNYSRRKIFIASTPVMSGKSRIQRYFELSNQQFFFLPCPHCHHMQALRFENLTWPKGKPENAVYKCENEECGKLIHDHQKNFMLPRGEWRAEHPELGGGRIVGFHLSSMYSPVGWLSWGDIATKWERAEGDREQQQVFWNTVLGLPWADQGEAADPERLYERREDYPIGTVPQGGLLLTAGADVQKNRIEIEVVAWGRDRLSWSVDYVVLEGDTNQPEIYTKLAQLMDQDYPTVYGGKARIAKLAIDTGFNTLKVYDWVRDMTPARVMGIKGNVHSSALVNVPTLVEVGPQGRRLKHGARVWPVNVSIGKEQLYRWLKLSQPDLQAGEKWPTGYCHFPQYSKDYFEQLCAEQLVTRTKNGLRVTVWDKIRDRNEALDARVYAMAAAASLRLEAWTPEKWDEVQKNLTIERTVDPQSAVRPKSGMTASPMPNFRAFGARTSFTED